MSERQSSARFMGWIGLALVLALTLVVFLPSFANGLLNWDDPVNVTQNRAIREISAANIRTWFTSPLLGMYSPLVYLSYALDYQVSGLNPWMYHATNLALHLVCVVLVYAVLVRLTQPGIAALAAAALFAVHPANVAAVTPISLRSSLLYSSFYLSAWLTYIVYLSRPARWRLALTFLLFCASGLSKSAAVTFPVLLVLTDYFRGRKVDRGLWIEKIPFAAAAVAFAIVTLYLRADVRAAGLFETSAYERVALAAYQLGVYAVHAIAPFGLSPFYPYPERAGGSFGVIVLAAPLIVVAVAMLFARGRALRRPILFGISFFVLHLALVLKVVPLGEEFMADRYLYLPLIGLLVVAAAFLAGGPSRWPQTMALIGVVAIWSSVSYARQREWHDDLTFNSRIIERYPRAPTAYSNRSAAKLQLGDVHGALEDSTEAIRLDSANARAYFNRATANMLLGRPSDALADVNRAIEIDPALPASFALRAQARLNGGDLAGARDDADRAIALAPEGDEVFKSYVTRGLARAMLNDGRGALSDLDRAIELNPGEPALLQNRGQVRATFGDIAGGCADLKLAVERGREDARALVRKWCGGVD